VQWAYTIQGEQLTNVRAFGMWDKLNVVKMAVRYISLIAYIISREDEEWMCRHLIS